MTNPLDGARTKLARADEHLDSLEREVARLLDSDADRGGFEIRPEGAWYVVVTKPLVLARPLRLSAIAGDVVHNLRSALDYVVCELVRAAGGKPSRRNAFPIFTKREEFLGVVAYPKKPTSSPLYGIDPQGEPWAVIEKAQPFNAPDPEFAQLVFLNALSNRDKHTALHVQMVFVSSEALDAAIGWNSQAILVEKRWNADNPLALEEGAELMGMRFDPAGPEPNVYVKSQLGLTPTFGDEDRQTGVGGLRELSKSVSRTVALFDRFL